MTDQVLSTLDATVWTPCYVALGSNLDQPMQQVRRACDALARLPATHLMLISSLYESQPMGPQDQPAFINAVAGLLTQLSAAQLLQHLQEIEQRMGRVRPAVHWGARNIDLDLLRYGEMRSVLPELQLPHPGMLQRNFVMLPLAEFAPALPVSAGQTAGQVARELGSAGVRCLRDFS